MKEFNNILKAQFEEMCKSGKLFRVDVSGQAVWDAYLKSFSNDPIFRDPESSEHNCNLCNNFVRRYGNIVSINDKFEIVSIFDVKVKGEYQETAKILSKLVRSGKIKDVFFETYDSLNSLNYEKCSKHASTFRLGLAENHKMYSKEEAEKYGVVKEGEVRTFNHMHLDLPKEFVNQSGKSIESLLAEYRAPKDVFQRGMEEIPVDTLNLVRDLIKQGSLLDGETHLYKIDQFIPLKKEYDELSKNQKDNWCWVKSYNLPFAKFKGELIGTLCTELAEGEDLNKACSNWNKRVDPVNYMKAVAPITKRQIEEAQKFVQENGYEESFDRRFATLQDVKVSEILHVNVGDNKIKSVSLFDNVKATSTRHKRNEFDGVEEVTIEKFMKDILPTATGVEALLKNNHLGNMVSLTTANNPESKKIFKWDNNYSWTFNGNLAGKSQLAEMVEAKGGRTDGVFRFTQSWNELEPNRSLMDLHVFMPGNSHRDDNIPHNTYGTGKRVGWNSRKDIASGGSQDVDYTSEAPIGYIPVENITFPDLSKMPEGKYICKIHNWNFRHSGGRGRAEIAFQGEVFQYIYPTTKNHQWITVAEVTLKNGVFSIEHKLPLENEQSKEIYGLETNSFHKVNLVCLSPNHWGNNQVGNKHYLFMLEGCKSPTSIRSFHNENLIPELVAHRKVLEVLGVSNMIEPTEKQLSGLGYNSTVRDELIVRLSGTHKRVVKIKF